MSLNIGFYMREHSIMRVVGSTMLGRGEDVANHILLSILLEMNHNIFFIPADETSYNTSYNHKFSQLTELDLETKGRVFKLSSIIPHYNKFQNQLKFYSGPYDNSNLNLDWIICDYESWNEEDKQTESSAAKGRAIDLFSIVKTGLIFFAWRPDNIINEPLLSIWDKKLDCKKILLLYDTVSIGSYFDIESDYKKQLTECGFETKIIHLPTNYYNKQEWSSTKRKILLLNMFRYNYGSYYGEHVQLLIELMIQLSKEFSDLEIDIIRVPDFDFVWMTKCFNIDKDQRLTHIDRRKEPFNRTLFFRNYSGGEAYLGEEYYEFHSPKIYEQHDENIEDILNYKFKIMNQLVRNCNLRILDIVSYPEWSSFLSEYSLIIQPYMEDPRNIGKIDTGSFLEGIPIIGYEYDIGKAKKFSASYQYNKKKSPLLMRQCDKDSNFIDTDLGRRKKWGISALENMYWRIDYSKCLEECRYILNSITSDRYGDDAVAFEKIKRKYKWQGHDKDIFGFKHAKNQLNEFL